MRGDSATNFETTFISKAGEEVILNLKAKPLLDASGQVVGAQGTATDITERRQEEEALKVSEEKFRNLFEHANDSIFIIDPSTRRFLDINEKAATQLQYTKDELLQKSADDLYPPAETERIPQIIQELTATGSVLFESIHLRKDKSEMPVEISSRVIEYGGRQVFQSFVRDITERKRAEEQFQGLAEGSIQGIFVQRNFKILFANQAMADLIGQESVEDVLALDLYEMPFIAPHERNRIRNIAKARMRGENPPNRLEVQGIKPDGALFWTEILAAKVNWEGEPALQTTYTDITERKKAEGELARHREQLEEMVEERTKELHEAQEQLVRREKLAVLGQLAGGVGHELRNPLGAIKNAAYFLNMALENPEPEVKDTLEVLNEEVTTSEKIIESLLDFARPKPPTRQKVDINEVVLRALDRASLPGTIVTVIRLDEALPPILTDPDQLSQIFGNIILNAIQAMPDGGRLEVSSEFPIGDGVAVSFSDTGAGIPQENLAKLFEPLFTTKAKGIGLGLALTKTLVEGQGGTIEVSSEVGKGSTFTVRLPAGSKEQTTHG